MRNFIKQFNDFLKGIPPLLVGFLYVFFDDDVKKLRSISSWSAIFWALIGLILLCLNYYYLFKKKVTTLNIKLRLVSLNTFIILISFFFFSDQRAVWYVYALCISLTLYLFSLIDFTIIRFFEREKFKNILLSVIISVFIFFSVEFFVSNPIFSSMNIENTQKNGTELREDTKEDDKHWTGPRGIQDSLDSNSKDTFIYNDIVEAKAEAKDYARSHGIEGSFGTSNNNRKDEVADTKRKVQLPNEVNQKKSISSSVQEADTKMSQLKNKGFVHLGQVHSINEKKKWKVTQSYTQYKKDDDFYQNYYSKTINIGGLKMLIFDDTNFGNGTISKTPHEYKVIGDIVLVNQGDYEDAWIYIEK